MMRNRRPPRQLVVLPPMVIVRGDDGREASRRPRRQRPGQERRCRVILTPSLSLSRLLVLLLLLLLSTLLRLTSAKRYACRGTPTPPCEMVATEKECANIPGCQFVLANDDDDDDEEEDDDELFICVHDGTDCGYAAYRHLNQTQCEDIGCDWNEYWTRRRIVLTTCIIIIIITMGLLWVLCLCRCCRPN
mmetsp:Transcript_14850/g.30309  ORF Transcript_14850/g.30309 Transcript_14850/m.30309 type:complete len:190 (-) Transcript_14850:49-618(-)